MLSMLVAAAWCSSSGTSGASPIPPSSPTVPCRLPRPPSGRTQKPSRRTASNRSLRHARFRHRRSPASSHNMRKERRTRLRPASTAWRCMARIGYLIDQFLRDGTNKRTDTYGGSIENRMRFLLEVVDAVTAAVGAVRTGLRISPQNSQNDIADSDPQSLFNRVAAVLSGRGLAYLHVIEGDTSGAPVPPFDYFAIKRLFGGIFMANNGFDRGRANEAIAQGRAELVAFGKPFISNPDLVTRLYLDVPLCPLNRETLYGGTEQGYTDYPVLRTVAPHACHADAERAWG